MPVWEVTVEIDKPEKTIVKRRKTEDYNSFRGMTISTVNLQNMQYLFYYPECLNFKENFTAFLKE